MKTFRILHITDLHLDSPDGLEENLRSANFKPFIKLMLKEMATICNDPIDYVITTGDYVNRGKVENFEHCKNIFNFLASELSLSPERFYTCVGNHDFAKEDDLKDPVIARKSYYDFSSSWEGAQRKVIHKESIFEILLCLDLDVYFLIFDSTFGADGTNVPSKLSLKERDRIYGIIEQNVPENACLFVLSHYPMDRPMKTEFYIEEDNWVEKHFWKDAYDILHKLNATRDRKATAYFHGDGHSPDFWSYSEIQHAFMTGMIGGRHEPSYETGGVKKVYNKVTECKLVELTEEGTCTIHTLQFANDGFDFSTNRGSWKHSSSEPRFKTGIVKHLASKPKIADNKSSIDTPRVDVISTSIEDEIIKEVEAKNLYSFGRHITSDESASLGWIDIDTLLNNRRIFARCVEKAKDWINEFLPQDLTPDKIVYIGLDFWGSCLAAQVSVLTDCRNFCIGTKSKGRFNIQEEKLESIIREAANDWRYFFIFSDVVSTGNSVDSVAKTILSMNPGQGPVLVSISIITDIEQSRDQNLGKFARVATFCSKLRIPVIASSKLPDTTILPPKLDIS